MKIRDLTEFFTPKSSHLTNQPEHINRNLQQPIKKQRNFDLINNETTFTPATTVNLLKFIICKKLAGLDKQLDKELIIQFTKRTRLKQQTGKTKFAELPAIIKHQYENLGDKFLQWLTTEFVSGEINKIIIDRLPEHNQKQQVNLRVTLYYQNHPRDLNLKVTSQINNLKQTQFQHLIQRLKTINNWEINFDYQFQSPTELLQQLAEILNSIHDKQTVHQLFKCLIGFKPYYLLIAEPKPIIADFTKQNLPDKLEVDYKRNQLVIHFDNDYHLTAEITIDQETPYLEIDFETLPNELEVFSF